MPKFYFTYGTEGQPFSGGWTEVIADTMRAATLAFRAYHPDKTEGVLNCSDMYTEAQFAATGMNAADGNCGYFCHEIITLQTQKVCCLKYIGRDSWSRPVYQEESGTLWKDVDPTEGRGPKLCTAVNNAFDGEPCDPMYIMSRYKDVEIRLIPQRDTWDNPIDN